MVEFLCIVLLHLRHLLCHGLAHVLQLLLIGRLERLESALELLHLRLNGGTQCLHAVPLCRREPALIVGQCLAQRLCGHFELLCIVLLHLCHLLCHGMAHVLQLLLIGCLERLESALELLHLVMDGCSQQLHIVLL